MCCIYVQTIGSSCRALDTFLCSPDKASCSICLRAASSSSIADRCLRSSSSSSCSWFIRAVLTELASDVAERRELTWLRLLSADPVRELTALSPVPGRRGAGAQGNALTGQPRYVSGPSCSAEPAAEPTAGPMVVIRCVCVGTRSSTESLPKLCPPSSMAGSCRADLCAPTLRTVVMISAERLEDDVPGGAPACCALRLRLEFGQASTASSSSIRTRCCHTRACWVPGPTAISTWHGPWPPNATAFRRTLQLVARDQAATPAACCSNADVVAANRSVRPGHGPRVTHCAESLCAQSLSPVLMQRRLGDRPGAHSDSLDLQVAVATCIRTPTSSYPVRLRYSCTQLGSHDATKFGTKLTGAAEPSDAALGADDVAQPDEEVNSCWPNGVRREPRPALRQRLRGCS